LEIAALATGPARRGALGNLLGNIAPHFAQRFIDRLLHDSM
jgi:hypothetical protein